ncbi:MAG: CHAP domain-containing protein [Oscillospiraceae bacterium]
MVFTPRTTSPAYEDLNQIHVGYPGGKNHALVINSSSGSVLSNCTGYVHFRALELCGAEVESRLCLYNAVAYWDYTQDGLERGQEPRIGAIAVWSGGGKGYGHVAIVEAVYSDGSILTSNSNYSGARFYTKHLCKPYIPWSGYGLLGFIYLPVSAEPKYIGSCVERDRQKHQVEVLHGALRARKRPEMNDEVILGCMNKGMYDVLQTRDMTSEASNGYFWYSPATDVWFARNDGEWTNDMPAEDTAALREQVDELTAENAELKKTLGEVGEKCDAYRMALSDIANRAGGAIK